MTFSGVTIVRTGNCDRSILGDTLSVMMLTVLNATQKQVPSCDCGCSGFVRMGIEHNAKLVPVVVMGEINALQNPIDLPGLQRWTYKNLGFPVPYWVVGRWGVSPFPKRAGLKFIIGEPICPRPHVPGTKVTGGVWFDA